VIACLIGALISSLLVNGGVRRAPAVGSAPLFLIVWSFGWLLRWDEFPNVFAMIQTNCFTHTMRKVSGRRRPSGSAATTAATGHSKGDIVL